MQQDNQQTTDKQQETENNSLHKEENGAARTGNAATQLVPQQGEIKNNDHDPGADDLSGSKEA